MPKLSVLVEFLALLSCASRSTERSQWWVVDQAAGTDFEILVQTGWSGCDTLDRVDVVETAGTVEIQTFFSAYDGDGLCTASIPMERVTVSLEGPIGNRSLRGCFPEGSVLYRTADPSPVVFGDCRDDLRLEQFVISND